MEVIKVIIIVGLHEEIVVFFLQTAKNIKKKLQTLESYFPPAWCTVFLSHSEVEFLGRIKQVCWAVRASPA